MKYITSTILVLLAFLYSFSTISAAASPKKKNVEVERILQQAKTSTQIKLERITGIIKTLEQCTRHDASMSCGRLFQVLLNEVDGIDKSPLATDQNEHDRILLLNTCFYSFLTKGKTTGRTVTELLDHAKLERQKLIGATPTNTTTQKTKSSRLEKAAIKATEAISAKIARINLIIQVLENFLQHDAAMLSVEVRSQLQFNIEGNCNADETDEQAAHNLTAFSHTLTFVDDNESEQTIEALLDKAQAKKGEIMEEAQLLRVTLMVAMMHTS